MVKQKQPSMKKINAAGAVQERGVRENTPVLITRIKTITMEVQKNM